jgi:hypothetical protein
VSVESRTGYFLHPRIEDRSRDDVSGDFRAPGHRLLLAYALMRASGVVEADKLGDQLSQVHLVEDEHMVEQFSSERPRSHMSTSGASSRVAFRACWAHQTSVGA